MNYNTKAEELVPLKDYVIIRAKKKSVKKAGDAGILLSDDAAINLANEDAKANPYLEIYKTGQTASDIGIAVGMEVLIPADMMQQAMILPVDDEDYFYSLHNVYSIVVFKQKLSEKIKD